jgi:rhodanese-related sulfurtransferase
MLNQTDSTPRRIQPEEAHAASRAGQALLVDVRDMPLYQNAHLDPSISLPLTELEAAGSKLPAHLTTPENALIILYCA